MASGTETRTSESQNAATRTPSLIERVDEIGQSAKADAIAAAYHDYELETEWSYHGDTWFHAASTIKVPLLLAVFDGVEQGRFSLETKVHVRNRFLSVVDGEAFRVSAGRDANSKVHAARGKKMTVGELAYHMIVTSSNLATNLLFELVGLEEAQKTMTRLGLDGIELKRGVEDERAFDAGINNRVTANGLLRVFRTIEEKRGFAQESSEKMLEILHDQEFKSGIPAGLPSTARVAHKTGEISTVAHDAGLVFIEGRKPYAIVILTEWQAERSGRQETVAKASRLIYEQIVGKERVSK